MKSVYYQFVNFIQNLHPLWFVTIVLLLFAVTLVLVMKFFKKYDGTQTSFEKISSIVLAIIIFAVLVYLTSLRF